MEYNRLVGLQERVERAAEAALAEQQYVSMIDVLLRLGWLPAPRLDEWRQGRADSLEATMQVGPGKVVQAIELFGRWAHERGLVPTEIEYVARTRDRRRLRFSRDGATDVERIYRTHWVAADLPAPKRERLVKRESEPPELVVIEPLNDWTCTVCSGTGEFLLMDRDGPLCLRCAKLDHLVFLPRGDAGLTRRAHRASSLSAVVVRFSRARRRYERQGLLVEAAALDSE
jgi:hypothetical protein